MGRGRPAKSVPEVSEEALRQVKALVKTYGDTKQKCLLIPRKRRSLFTLMQVTTENYDQIGRIEYNREAVERIHPEDRKVIKNYEQRMHDIWILEHGVAAIPDDRTRAIAEDTLLKGKTCVELEQKYGMTARGIRKRKRSALIEVAALAERINFCSVLH